VAEIQDGQKQKAEEIVQNKEKEKKEKDDKRIKPLLGWNAYIESEYKRIKEKPTPEERVRFKLLNKQPSKVYQNFTRYCGINYRHLNDDWKKQKGDHKRKRKQNHSTKDDDEYDDIVDVDEDNSPVIDLVDTPIGVPVPVVGPINTNTLSLVIAAASVPVVATAPTPLVATAAVVATVVAAAAASIPVPGIEPVINPPFIVIDGPAVDVFNLYDDINLDTPNTPPRYYDDEENEVYEDNLVPRVRTYL
jgi:hypothetical protein